MSRSATTNPSLPRRVEPEVLDGLGALDPRARRSRNDLRRLNRAMSTLDIVQRALIRGSAGFRPRTLLELGAGDGSLLLRLAERQAGHWPGVCAALLDRLNPVAPQTLDGLRRVGWIPTVVTMDVFDWLEGPDDTRWDVIFANLFIHHFSSSDVARLLTGIAARSRVFLCCEPRRSSLPLAVSHLVGLLGAGPVTRKDAVSSVHAGFRDRELSELWPERDDWALDEYATGLFSHCFLAVRNER